MQVYVDKKKVLVIAVLALAVLGPVAVWKIQALQIRSEFVEAMRAGKVTQFPPYLWEKQWTAQDLATAKVKKVVPIRGRERALSRSIHQLGEQTLSSSSYSYQASLVDTSTGMKYLFGRARNNPGQWMWAGIHADSMDQWIEQRGAEVDALEGRRVVPLPTS